jgi:hypothetical protein
MNNTIVNLRKSNYEKYNNRKRVFIPADKIYPQFNTNHNFTSTTWLTGIGPAATSGWRVATGPRFKRLQASNMICPVLNTSAQALALTWRIPDDFYGGEKTHVNLVFAQYNTTTSSAEIGYNIAYTPWRIRDFGTGSGTPEPAKAVGATAMSTACTETLTFSSSTYRWAPYRGMRGTINAGLLQSWDFVEFYITTPHAHNGGSIMVLGIEIEYEVRMRGNCHEKYSD